MQQRSGFESHNRVSLINASKDISISPHNTVWYCLRAHFSKSSASKFRFQVEVPLFSALFLSDVWEYQRKSYTAEKTRLSGLQFFAHNHFNTTGPKSHWIC